MRVAGDSILGARWVEIFFGLVALAAAAWIAYQLVGRVAAAVAALLLAVSPSFLVYSHTVEAEIPMAAMSALALALALFSRSRKNLVWPALAGLALAGAILLKLFAVEALLPALWVTIEPGRFSLRALRKGVIVLLAAAMPVALDFGLVSPLHQWQQVIDLHNRAASAQLPGLDPAATVLGRYFALELGLVALAIAGLIALALVRRWRELGFLVLWLPGSALMLLLFRPLFPHHAAILSVPLAVTAGVGAGVALQTGIRVSLAVRSIVGLAALIYLVAVPRFAHADRHALVEAPAPQTLLLAVWIDRHSSPAQLVAADDLKLADGADRLVVPPLCDPSNVRLRSGYLTAADLIGVTQTYRPKLVVSSLGIYQQVGGYITWLHSHYRIARSAPPPAIVFVRP